MNDERQMEDYLKEHKDEFPEILEMGTASNFESDDELEQIQKTKPDDSKLLLDDESAPLDPMYDFDEKDSREGDITIEKQIGNDDRVPVVNARRDPFNLLCCLTIHRHGNLGPLQGTGWIAGPRLVITAGHCVFRRRQRKWVRRIQVSRGRNGSSFISSQSSSRFRSTRQYVNPNTRNVTPYDFGAIILKEAIDVTPFSFSAYSDSQLRNLTVNVVGYPVDKPRQTMWRHGKPLLSLRDRRILRYQIDTHGGQSGAPVIDYIPGTTRDRDQFVVVGIHNSASSYREENWAARITPDVFRLIRSWRQS